MICNHIKQIKYAHKFIKKMTYIHIKHKLTHKKLFEHIIHNFSETVKTFILAQSRTADTSIKSQRH